MISMIELCDTKEEWNKLVNAVCNTLGNRESTSVDLREWRNLGDNLILTKIRTGDTYYDPTVRIAVSRKQVDQLDNLYIWRIEKAE